MRFSIILFLVSVISTPQTILFSQSAVEFFPITQPYESFVLLKKDTVGMKNRRLVAKINLKSSNYNVLMKMIEEKARQLGGNCLIITDHKQPGAWASNHRIKADVLHIDNPESFEKEILWHPLRPLKVCNFRASAEGKPTSSGSNTSIKFVISSGPSKGKVKAIVEAVFKSEKSFLSSSAVSNDKLLFEQLVFDLTEVYARKMRKLMAEELPNSADILEVLESHLSTVFEEWATKRLAFYDEIVKDHTAQEKWQEWIHGELNSLQDYVKTEVILATK